MSWEAKTESGINLQGIKAQFRRLTGIFRLARGDRRQCMSHNVPDLPGGNVQSTEKFRLRSVWFLAVLFLSSVTRPPVRGEVPNGRWAAVAAFGGAGVRFTPTPRVSLESRVLYGDGVGVSVRGGMQWDKEGWKIRPLAGLEASVFAPYHGKGERGESLLLYMGGEIRLARPLTFQMDIGPALLRLHDENTKKETWEYQNVLNVSLNYYFGKRVR